MTTTLPQAPAAPAPVRPVPRQRRSRSGLLLGLVLVAAGGLGDASLYASTGTRIQVLALTRDVPAGRPLTAADLTVASITTDPALAPVAADSQARVQGQRAAVDLKRGQLLTAADVTSAPLVLPGQQVIGLPAKADQLPAEPLHPGVRVSVVATAAPGDTGTAGAPVPGTSYTATVVAVGEAGADGTTVVDVAVAQDKAGPLVQLTAAGTFTVTFAPGSR